MVDDFAARWDTLFGATSMDCAGQEQAPAKRAGCDGGFRADGYDLGACSPVPDAIRLTRGEQNSIRFGTLELAATPIGNSKEQKGASHYPVGMGVKKVVPGIATLYVKGCDAEAEGK